MADAPTFTPGFTEMRDLLIFIQSGLRRGKIKDVSVIPPAPKNATSMDLTSLSEMVDAALAKASGAS